MKRSGQVPLGILRIVLIGFSTFWEVQTILMQGGPPLITDDPDTPGNRHWEINLGFILERLENDPADKAPGTSEVFADWEGQISGRS